ncbi:hypothetical protein [Noviherbaspirillum agri]
MLIFLRLLYWRTNDGDDATLKRGAELQTGKILAEVKAAPVYLLKASQGVADLSV